MVFRWLVNFGLLALPIAATLGVLLGLQSHRRATGQPLLFVDNGIKKERYCQKSFGIHPETLGQEYTCEFSHRLPLGHRCEVLIFDIHC